MKNQKKIIVTGGAGYIGSHCVISLIDKGYVPIVLDNFSNSYSNILQKIEKITKKKVIFYKVDLMNTSKINSIFKKHACHAVIHCAGFKSVNESSSVPIRYFDNNIQSTLSMLESMRKNKVFRLIFSSSASVYNSDQKPPLDETALIGKTSNPYGTSKYLIECILKDLSKFDHRWKIGIARYFNPISNHFSGLIKDNPKDKFGNLIFNIINVAKKKQPYLRINGNDYKTKDGTCVRDFIHIVDLAEGHTAMLKANLLKNGCEIYNFGTGKGYTVKELIRAFEKNMGIKIPLKYFKRRKGDIPISYCKNSKAKKKLSWKPKYDIDKAMIDIKSMFENF